MGRWARSAVAALALAAVVSDVHAQSSSSSRVMSPTVVTTYVARQGELTLLVLWRGTPGWFMRGGGGKSSGGGGSAGPGAERGWEYLTIGGMSWTIEFDYGARTARLLEQDIALARTNVVLVDQVDSPTGARMVSLQWVDPTLTAEGDPAMTIIRRTSALAEFLQCGLAMSEPVMQAMIAIVCRQATGR